MSDIYRKARVQLLNDSTGEAIGEVEIISDSQEIFYNNDRPTLKQIGNIPAGTTFDKTSVADIIDGLLYEEVDYHAYSYTTSNGDLNNVSEDTTIIKPITSRVGDFTLNAILKFGSKDKISCTVEVSRPDGYSWTSTITVERSGVEQYKIVSFNIKGFDSDTAIRVSNGPIITYKFVAPTYIGWVTPEVIKEDGELDMIAVANRIQELIDHKFKTLETRYVDKSDQIAMIVPGINYDTRERLNPCILIPEPWGGLTSITDMNGNNIANSYAMCHGIKILTEGNKTVECIAYVSRQTFDDDEDFIRAITYKVDMNQQTVNMGNYEGNATPLTVGYSVMYNIPLDERFHRKTYGDLLKMLYPYPGLQTYVEDINTTFRFEHGHWTPVSTKTHIIEDRDELTSDFGGWDDIAINSTNGEIYKKRYNNVWEMWGTIKVNTDNNTINLDMKETED